MSLSGRLRRRIRFPSTEAGRDPSPIRAELDSLDSADRGIVERSLKYSMTSVARLQSVIDAVRYCEGRRIPGAFVECGVWRGGSVLAMILALQELNRADRHLFLFDTFEGMTEPSERDVSRFARPAVETWAESGGKPWEEVFGGGAFNEADVHKTITATGYPEDRLHFIRGRVEDTIPGEAPPEIALLRLDTDWYESTRHELAHLYPRLSAAGVLIVDDYGHWEGCRQAVDEYFSEQGVPIFLSRIDYTARLAIKA